MYTFRSRVRYSETDSRELLTLSAITDYFQDCGTFQSEELGLGVHYLQESHLAWVLSAWQIVVEEYPHLGDDIIISTFPYAFKGFLGYRNYTMDRADGRRMAYANAVWTLLDTRKMTPVRATREMMEKYVLSDRLAMEYAPRKIAGAPGTGSGDALTGEWQEGFLVKRYQLDSNHHVNNAWYIKMAACYLPAQADIMQMRAEYRRQALQGDRVIPYVAETGQKHIISLCNEEKEPYAVIEFTHRA